MEFIYTLDHIVGMSFKDILIDLKQNSLKLIENGYSYPENAFYLDEDEYDYSFERDGIIYLVKHSYKYNIVIIFDGDVVDIRKYWDKELEDGYENDLKDLLSKLKLTDSKEIDYSILNSISGIVEMRSDYDNVDFKSNRPLLSTVLEGKTTLYGDFRDDGYVVTFQLKQSNGEVEAISGYSLNYLQELNYNLYYASKPNYYDFEEQNK